MSNTIAQSLTALGNAKQAIAAAIAAKGGTVGSGDGFADFAVDINTISDFSYVIDANWQPGSSTNVMTLNGLTLNGLIPKCIIVVANAAGTFGNPAEHIVSAYWVAAGSVTHRTVTGCTKFNGGVLKSYGSTGRSYVNFAPFANGFTATTIGDAKWTSEKSYHYVVMA